MFHLATAACIFSIYGKTGFITGDTDSYVAPAVELVKYGTFSVNGVPETMRTPGYPLFLAMFVGLPDFEFFVVMAQCFITGLIAVVTYKLAESLAGARAGCFAAFLFTVFPLTVTYTSFILTERLFSFFVIMLCAAMFKFIEKPCAISVILAAAASVFGAFVRPAAIFIPYGVIVFIIFFGIVKKINVVRFVAVFLLISVTPIKLWEYRNLLMTDYKGFSSVSAINLYFYNAAGTLAKLENKYLTDKQNEMGLFNNDIYKARHPEQNGLSQGEIFNSMAKEGKKIIKNNLYVYAKVHLTGMLYSVIIPGTHNLVRKSWSENSSGFRRMKHGKDMPSFIITVIKEMPITFTVLVSSAILLALVYLLFAIGLVTCARIRPFETAFLLLTAAYFILITGNIAATDRFRDPISSIIAIFAGIGINRLIAYIAIKQKTSHLRLGEINE